MQNFNFEEEATSSFELCEKGPYELRIESADLKTENGKSRIALTIVVRDDVEQPHAGNKIWDSIWKNTVYRDSVTNKRIKKDDYEALPASEKQKINVYDEFDDFKIRKLVWAQDVDREIIENGVSKKNPDFQDSFPGGVEEVVQFLNGLCFFATVLKVTNDKTGKESNQIDYKTVKRTSVHYNPKQNSAVKEVEIDDNDLPF